MTKQTRYIPVTKWSKYHPWPKIGGLRHLIFHADSNGFNKVIVRAGRRVLINEEAFFEWLNKHQQNNKPEKTTNDTLSDDLNIEKILNQFESDFANILSKYAEVDSDLFPEFSDLLCYLQVTISHEKNLIKQIYKLEEDIRKRTKRGGKQ